jgi:tetratricopeptide (TPR) repeat protein
MEELFQDSLPEYFEILAEHFALGENFIKSAEYYQSSYKKILKAASPFDAVKYAVKRIECLEKSDKNDDIEKQIIESRIVLGFLYVQMNYYTHAMQAIQPVIAVAEKKAGKKKIVLMYTVLGSYQYMVEENFPEAFKLLKKAVELAKEANDFIAITRARYWLGVAQGLQCEFKEAEHNINQLIEVNKAADILWGIAALKSLVSYFVYYYEGSIEKGFRTSFDAVQCAEESHDAYSKGMAYAAHGVFCYYKGFVDKAERYLIKGIKFCEKSKNFTWHTVGQACMGELYYETKKYDRSLHAFNKALYWAKTSDLGVSILNLAMIGAALAKSAMGDQNINLKELTKLADDIRMPVYEGCKSRFLSEILINISNENHKHAEELKLKAIQADIRNGMNFSLGQDYYTYSQLLVKSGDHDKASIYHKKAEEAFQKCGADKYLETIDSYK